jgi:hypothetical protein
VKTKFIVKCQLRSTSSQRQELDTHLFESISPAQVISVNMRLEDLDDPIPLIPRKRRQPPHRSLRNLARSEVKIEYRVDDKGLFGLGTDDDESKCRGRFIPEAVDQGGVGDRCGLMGLVWLGRGSRRGLRRQSLSCMYEKLLLVSRSCNATS